MTRVADFDFSVESSEELAAQFDGVADYGDVPASRAMSLGEGTLVIDASVADLSKALQTLVSVDSNTEKAAGRLSISVAEGGVVRVDHSDPQRTQTLSGGALITGNPFRIAYSWGPDGSHLVVDNTVVDRSDAALVLAGDENPMVIAASSARCEPGSTQSLCQFFKGTIKRIQVFDEDLGQPETFNGFAPETQVMTPSGPVEIGALRPGDLVATVDAGVMPVRWVHRVTHTAAALAAIPSLVPVEMARGVLDNETPIILSQGVGVIADDEGPEVLLRAGDLAQHVGEGFDLVDHEVDVTYVNVMFDQHHLILVEGVPCTSLFRGDAASVLAVEVPDDAPERAIRHSNKIGNEAACRPVIEGDAARSLMTGGEEQGPTADPGYA